MAITEEDIVDEVKIFKSKSNESLDLQSKYNSRKSSGHVRKKSGHKIPSHKPNKSVIENVDDEDMDKIINDLKYFKEHINASKKSVANKVVKKESNPSQKKTKEPINESGDNTTAPSQQASRPRTSRGNRPSSKINKRGEGSGGNSAMGFHSNVPHHLLYNNLDKPLHNRSVNEGGDSPRSRKRKLSKGRISPNTFVGHHQRQPSAIIKHKNPKRNTSLENDKMAVFNKNRPQSANIKKKHGKSAERMKKSALNRQRLQDEQDSLIKYVNQPIPNFSKDGLVSKSMIENHLGFNEGSSFDREDILRHKIMQKNLVVAKNADMNLSLNSNTKAIITKKNNKFMMYKRPDGTINKSVAYEQLNYIDTQYKPNNISMDRSVFRKAGYQLDKKRQAKVVTTQSKGKGKSKRSATPSLIGPSQYIAQGLTTNNFMKRKNIIKAVKGKGIKGLSTDHINPMLI